MIWQIIGGTISLLILWTTWWINKNNSVKKAKDDEDKKIDSVSNADDILIELDRLREPPTNRS